MYIENPIFSTKKLHNLISEFSKVEGYKVNIQKLMAFFNAINKFNNELSGRENQEKIPSTIATK